MDAGFAVAIMALFLLLFGIVTGVGLGDELSKRCVTKGEYLRANLGALLLGSVACALVLMSGLTVLLGLVIGIVAGTITGLKMGFGESVGPWKFVDKHFRANKDQLRRSENSAQAEAVRRARRDGTPEPEFISVQQDGPASRGQAGGRKGGRK